MRNQKLISFDLRADFGFFKKPDYNDGLLLSYNMLHKPALLGILGAIAGMEGYQRKGELPQYYTRLKHLRVGIAPMLHEQGNFRKTAVKYTNTVGYANEDGNLLVEETMLINPCYRCYLLLNMQSNDEAKLYDLIMSSSAEYIPYMGKNEYQAWMDAAVEYDYEPMQLVPKDFSISSLFVREGAIAGQRVEWKFDYNLGSMTANGSFCYFERLPIGFDERLRQYEMGSFAYTDWLLKPSSIVNGLFAISADGYGNDIIQLF